MRISGTGTPDPLALGAPSRALDAPPITLSAPVPHEHATVQLPMQDFAHTRGRPRSRAPEPARGRGGDALGIQGLGDPLHVVAEHWPPVTCPARALRTSAS